jgi:hypothetical protein
MQDLLLDNARDGLGTEPIRPRPPEGGVQVGTDGPGRAGSGERMTGTALLDEQCLAVHHVVSAVDDFAATRRERCGSCAGERQRTHQRSGTDAVGMLGRDVEGRGCVIRQTRSVNSTRR